MHFNTDTAERIMILSQPAVDSGWPEQSQPGTTGGAAVDEETASKKSEEFICNLKKN